MSSEATQISDATPSDVVSTGMQVTHPGLEKAAVEQLPSGWKFTALGELAAFRTGPFGSALHKSDYIDDGIPLINPMHIIDGALLPESQASVSERAAKRLADFRFRRDDIVMGRRGDMGRCAVVRDSQVGWLCGTGCLIIRCIGDVDVAFLQRVLTTERIVGLIEDSSVGSTMVNLNHAALARLPIQCPPLREQRAIAEALSDVDGLLGALEALIAKKRAIKQAAMQQLLTGKTRLPGFSGEWETKHLGGIGHFLKGRGVKRDDAQSGHLACVRYGEIYTTHHDYICEFNSRISPEVAATATRLEVGDLLFAGSGETKEEIGKCVALVLEEEAYAGGDIVILRPSNGDSLFLGYALNMPSVARQKASFGQGDAVVHISAAALAQVSLSVPSSTEQTAIATVLSDMDAEIAALEARQDKTRQIKQGMMQQLLTGRVRLIEAGGTVT